MRSTDAHSKWVLCAWKMSKNRNRRRRSKRGRKGTYIIWLPLADLLWWTTCNDGPCTNAYGKLYTTRMAKWVEKVFFSFSLFFPARILACACRLAYMLSRSIGAVSDKDRIILLYLVWRQWVGECVFACVLHDIQCYHVLIIHTKIENNFCTISSSSSSTSTSPSRLTSNFCHLFWCLFFFRLGHVVVDCCWLFLFGSLSRGRIAFASCMSSRLWDGACCRI